MIPSQVTRSSGVVFSDATVIVIDAGTNHERLKTSTTGAYSVSNLERVNGPILTRLTR